MVEVPLYSGTYLIELSYMFIQCNIIPINVLIYKSLNNILTIYRPCYNKV